MKHIICVILVAGLLSASSSFASGEICSNRFDAEQTSPFSFTSKIPAKIKLSGNVNLSFYVNQAMVFQYRYRLEVPQGGSSSIDKSLLNWTGWINKDINEIIVSKLANEGRYRFVVEYKTHTSNEIKRIEKWFEVYYTRPVPTAALARNNTHTAPATDNPKPIKPALADNQVHSENSLDSQRTVNDEHIQAYNKPIIQPERNDWKTAEPQDENTPETTTISENIEPVNFDLLLREAIDKEDATLIKESITNNANINIKGLYGGNIFHILGDNTASDDLIPLLKKKGLSINELDNFSNTPLHYAILKGESLYARRLIDEGANLNLTNQISLTPLHLAVLLNNRSVVKDLLAKGANVNAVGNTGYIPIHIAAEMNNLEIAGDLIRNGANATIKTDQRLTSKTIAKIQMNNNIVDLIHCKGSCTASTSTQTTYTHQINSNGTYPKIDFNLPYDQKLIRNRNTAKVIQIISVPVFALCAAGSTYLKLEANNYYSLYKEYQATEGSMDLAKYNYDKTLEYDKYFYISGSISLVPIYTFIHSTIWKRNVTNRMRKIF